MKKKLIFLITLFSGITLFVYPQSLKSTDFRIAVIPDIQYYTAQVKGGDVRMFRDQISWIRKHAADSNIVYVSGLGDNVDNSVAGGVMRTFRINTVSEAVSIRTFSPYQK
jgi:hypothetical protein